MHVFFYCAWLWSVLVNASKIKRNNRCLLTRPIHSIEPGGTQEHTPNS